MRFLVLFLGVKYLLEGRCEVSLLCRGWGAGGSLAILWGMELDHVCSMKSMLGEKVAYSWGREVRF